MTYKPNADSLKLLASQKLGPGIIIVRTNVFNQKEDFMDGDTCESNFVYSHEPYVFDNYDQASQLLTLAEGKEAEKRRPMYTFKTYILGT